MSKKITIEVVFRYDKEYDYVQMFYYDEHKSLVCFCLEEGHGEAGIPYYRSTKHTNGEQPQSIKDKIQRIINYYTDDETELRVMKKLKHGVCSY